ncbi:MAG: translation initiation factor IF-2 [Elusimicrobia bacterium]|nr:translation initiation factor IF-2 [Elusimicrobiota bacterium]
MKAKKTKTAEEKKSKKRVPAAKTAGEENKPAKKTRTAKSAPAQKSKSEQESRIKEKKPKVVAGPAPRSPRVKIEKKVLQEKKTPAPAAGTKSVLMDTPVPAIAPAAPSLPARPETEKKEVPKPPPSEPEKPALIKLKVSTQAILRELAEKMGIKPVDFIKKLMGLGVFATINQRLDPDVAVLAASEYGYDLEIIPIYGDEEAAVEEIKAEKPENLKPRPPVITIMGHVDHGKTTLLDALRESNVVATEAGQITQHIGAYTVKTGKGIITVLDTPGHEAFTAMRAHGVKITDMVILVVSAVDGVMPQTLEAINHARAADVPIIVAINKIDLPAANIQNIKQSLSNHGLVPEEWGGKTIMVEISAKKKINIDKLLGMMMLQAEIMDIKANPDKQAQGIVIEARLDMKRGNEVTIIVTSGTLSVGDPFVAGMASGKVRALITDSGERIQSVKPGYPAEMLGLTGVLPQAGDMLRVVESEKEARRISEKRNQFKREDSFIHQKHVSLLSLRSQVEQKLLKTLNIVLKTDVAGSLQAIKDSLEKLSAPEVAIHILHAGVGNINESDILLARASDAIIFGFNVASDSDVLNYAKIEGIEIRTYRIIYDILEDVKAAMSGLLEPEIVETVAGKAEVRQIFELSSGKVAGCLVREGKIARTQSVRVLRGKEIVFKGKLSSLKHFKEDVKEVEKGFECGIMIDGFRDTAVGDVIESLTREEKTRRIQ